MYVLGCDKIDFILRVPSKSFIHTVWVAQDNVLFYLNYCSLGILFRSTYSFFPKEGQYKVNKLSLAQQSALPWPWPFPRGKCGPPTPALHHCHSGRTWKLPAASQGEKDPEELTQDVQKDLCWTRQVWSLPDLPLPGLVLALKYI